MEKSLGFRLMDSIKELTEFEMSKSEVISAIYVRTTEQKVNEGIEKIV